VLFRSIYYMITTAIAIAIGLSFAYIVSPGKGLSIDVGEVEEVEVNESEGIIDTFLNIVPTNPFEALANADILQIIFFAVFVGLAITLIGDKQSQSKPFLSPFQKLCLK